MAMLMKMRLLNVILLIAWLLVTPVVFAQEAKEKELSLESKTKIEQLIKDLGADDWQIRENAQRQLEEIGESAIPFLELALEDPDPEIRMRAKSVISYIPTKAIRKRVKFSEGMLKEFPEIYQDLARLDAQGKFIILQHIVGKKKDYKDKITNKDMAGLIHEVLLDGGKGLGETEKRQIAYIIGHMFTCWSGTLYWHTSIPEAMPSALKLARDENSAVRHEAFGALYMIATKEDISEIMEFLNDNNWDVRRSAVKTLGTLGIKLDIKEIIPEIIKLLNDENKHVQTAAISALGYCAAKKAIPEIRKFLTDEDWRVRNAAVQSLSKLEAKEAIPEIMKLLNDEEARVRRVVIQGLGELGAREAIPEIIKLLKDNDLYVLNDAVRILGELGAKEAIPEIMKLLLREWDQDVGQEEAVRQAVIRALAKLGAKVAIPEMIKISNDTCIRWGSRTAAAESLALLEATGAIPNLIECLEDSNSIIRWKAAEALGDLGAQEAIPEIRKLLKDSEGAVSGIAAVVLGKLGAKEAIPEITKLLENKEEYHRGYAGIALVELGAKDKVPEKVIFDIKTIVSSRRQYRTRAVAALKELGVEIKE